MEAKSLTKEERFQVLNSKIRSIPDMQWAIDRALAAEQYWREAVKNNGYGIEGRLDGDEMCRYCEVWLHPKADDKHKSVCPWLLAQD